MAMAGTVFLSTENAAKLMPNPALGNCSSQSHFASILV